MPSSPNNRNRLWWRCADGAWLGSVLGTCAVVIFMSVFVDPPENLYPRVMWMFLGSWGGAIIGGTARWLEYRNNRDLERNDD